MFLCLALVSFSLWLGGYIGRHLIIFQLFEPKDLALKAYIQGKDLVPVFTTISGIFVFNLMCYPVFLISFALFLITGKINLKKEGWLFIITLMVFITAPFEAFLYVKDIRLALYLQGNFSGSWALSMVRERMIALSNFPLVEIFTYLGIIVLAVFKPLRMKDEDKE